MSLPRKMKQRKRLKRWMTAEMHGFVVHCYSGYENKVRHNLEQRIESMGMKDRTSMLSFQPQEEIEVRDGKRRSIERHVFSPDTFWLIC